MKHISENTEQITIQSHKSDISITLQSYPNP